MEEDAKKMTLREYQEMQKQEKVQPQFNLRKANEGADTNWMKGVTVVGPKANQEESVKVRIVDGERRVKCDGGHLFVGRGKTQGA